MKRRHLIAGFAALAVTPVRAQTTLDATSLGLVPGSEADQSELLQRAIDLAVGAGQVLRLPPGSVRAQGLNLPWGLVMEGAPMLSSLAPHPGAAITTIANIYERGSVLFRDIDFYGGTTSDAANNLFSFESASSVAFERCGFHDVPEIAIRLYDSALTIRDCAFSGIGDAAIHSMDGRGHFISGNRIDGCGNAGIRIWRGENGSDASIISGNRISNIGWKGGGNGQNGNGINVFKADEVIVSDNHIVDCAFTAVRLNSTNNTQVSGNTCLRSGEVAIFSEFAFSGSIITNNIIDGAATGISITNLDDGGQLAVCSGNIVRNITPVSAVNPDTLPIGIYAEAETAITGNTVQNVPGIGIAAGYGPYLRNVLISGNVISNSNIGIGVSVVDEAGAVRLGDNLIASPTEHAVVGLAWTEVVEPDLLANVTKYPNVSVN
ncbi:TIGR03808 family TAT-translocated repetitive protein [Devosia sp. SL43]|uniref:TIGR03808 family TAT-translocated repetitive protein n=1 Tax=Devosia sp. SL43 TaxID=2806348 RepID=UPI001F328595|nr:TIGR03808 family TAT-translocated repetitive protein [Devosia sp. SL43]UJW85479.1 TIGR03808 family TAT-translocated repetitive protein [Devosia sp. SL43]